MSNEIIPASGAGQIIPAIRNRKVARRMAEAELQHITTTQDIANRGKEKALQQQIEAASAAAAVAAGAAIMELGQESLVRTLQRRDAAMPQLSALGREDLDEFSATVLPAFGDLTARAVNRQFR